MTSRPTTRTCRPDDAQLLVPLFAALSHPTTAERLRDRLARLAGDPTYAAWVIEAPDGDAPAELWGFAAGHLLHPVEDDTPAAQLIALVTAEGARGRGVGTTLCAAFERWAVERGATRVALNSGTTRAEAHAFYRRRGYTASGLRFAKTL